MNDYDLIYKIIDDNTKLSNKTKRDFTNAILSVTDQYKILEDTLSTVIGGSISRSFADDSSDIEMYIYSRNSIPKEETVKLLLNNLDARLTRSKKYIWTHDIWGPHTFFMIEGVHFEVGYRIFSDIEKKVMDYMLGNDIYTNHTREADTPFGHYTSGIVSCIQYSKITYEDRTKKFTSLKKDLEKFPSDLKRKILQHYYNEANIMNKVKLKSAAYRDDSLAYNALLSSIIRSMNICIFTINESHFPGDKWNLLYIKGFKIKPPGFDDHLDLLLNESNRGLQNKAYKYLILERILKNIGDLIVENGHL